MRAVINPPTSSGHEIVSYCTVITGTPGMQARRENTHGNEKMHGKIKMKSQSSREARAGVVTSVFKAAASVFRATAVVRAAGPREARAGRAHNFG